MPAKPHPWDADIDASVAQYNAWFMAFAPGEYARAEVSTVGRVTDAFTATANLTNITPATIQANMMILPILRMACSPPLARDRLIGLSGADDSFVTRLDSKGSISSKMPVLEVTAELNKICLKLSAMLDPNLVVWNGRAPTPPEINRATSIIADRLCSSEAAPIVRYAQEKRQLKLIKDWLDARGYTRRTTPITDILTLKPGEYGFHPPMTAGGKKTKVRIPPDAVVMPLNALPGTLPLLIETKSAGDFANTNKRRKEEAQKMKQLRRKYPKVPFILFLCGYFGKTYLSYMAKNHFGWVWEHRLDDLATHL